MIDVSIDIKIAFKWSLLAILFCFGLTSCEDVIEVEVPTDEPRLVVNALMRVDINEQFIPVEVRLTLTNNFFDEISTTSAEDNIVIISQAFDEEGNITGTGTSSLWEEPLGSGIYVPDPTFDADQRIPVSATTVDIMYTMVIEHQGRRYAAQTKYVPAVPIDNLEIGDGTLFEDEETELIVTFTDDPDRDNFYVFDFGFSEFLTTEDQFYKGQQFQFSYFYDREFEPGTELEVSILGADQSFFNYMDLLIEQTDGMQGPFQTPVATARGNVFDVTGLDNIDIFDNAGRPEDFALGYFAIVQEYKATVTVE